MLSRATFNLHAFFLRRLDLIEVFLPLLRFLSLFLRFFSFPFVIRPSPPSLAFALCSLLDVLAPRFLALSPLVKVPRVSCSFTVSCHQEMLTITFPSPSLVAMHF